MQIIYTEDINAHSNELVAAQCDGGLVAIIDVNNELDPNYLSALGVDFETAYTMQPEDNEQAIDVVDSLHKSGCIDLIVTTQKRRRYEG